MNVCHFVNRKNKHNVVGEEADDGTYNKVPLRAIMVYILKI